MRIARRDIIAAIEAPGVKVRRPRYTLWARRRRGGWDVRFKDTRVDNKRRLKNG